MAVNATSGGLPSLSPVVNATGGGAVFLRLVSPANDSLAPGRGAKRGGGAGGGHQGASKERMVYFPNPGARAIAISMSVVHQHAGSPYINGRDEEFQQDHFPIGMVFIFVTFGGVGLCALMCGLLKLAEKRKERHRSIRSMPTLSMSKHPSPRRELLRHSNIDYLSIATLPLFSYQMFSRIMKLRGQGRGSLDLNSAVNGIDESEAAAENLSSPLDYEEAVNLDEYTTMQADDFCEIDLGKGELDYVNDTSNHRNCAANNLAKYNNVSAYNLNPGPLRTTNKEENLVMCINACESVV